MRRLLFWIVWNIQLGPLAPWLLGLALGAKPRRVALGRKCPDGLLPSGGTCPLCGARRQHTGIGGTWIHVPPVPPEPGR
jgi:hypothetical protein